MTSMTGTESITNDADIIDSREVIERIEYLRNSWAESTGNDPDDYELSEDDWRAGLSDDETAEIVALMELASEGESLSDWQYGETLVRNSHFEDYARELAEDIGAIDREASWPLYCIDWERAARELQMDYTSLDFDGVTYWARS